MGPKVADELQAGLLDVVLVAALVGLEPVSIVVLLEVSEKAKEGGAEGISGVA